MGRHSSDVVAGDVSAAASSQRCGSGGGVDGGETGVRLCAALCPAATCIFAALLPFDGASILLFAGEVYFFPYFNFGVYTQSHTMGKVSMLEASHYMS